MSRFKTSSLKLYENEKQVKPLSTLNKKLDENFRIIPGIITEICGKVGAPTTRLCMQLSISAIFSSDCKGTAIYIDTNQRFSPYLMGEICDQENLPRTILDRVVYAYCSDHIILIATLIQISLSDDLIKLIVIDSLVKPYRELQDVDERSREIHSVLDELQRIALDRKIPIVVTNEYTTQFTEDNQPKIVPALGSSYFHRIGQRLNFTNFQVFSSSKTKI